MYELLEFERRLTTKKVIAILIIVAVFCSTLSVGVHANEPRSWICSRCGGSAYYEQERSSVGRTVSVPSCENYVNMHSHSETTHEIFTYCESCGFSWKVYEYVTTWCPYRMVSLVN